LDGSMKDDIKFCAMEKKMALDETDCALEGICGEAARQISAADAFRTLRFLTSVRWRRTTERRCACSGRGTWLCSQAQIMFFDVDVTPCPFSTSSSSQPSC
jgi:hypothetical protein